MKSTVINTSKEMTSFSDFPPEDTMANFMHNTEMCRYLNNYAKHHELLKYIKFNNSVISIDRNDDYDVTGKWKVRYSDETGAEKTRIFDGVMLCSGHHAIPHIPKPWPGQEKFKGRITHSHDYKDHKGYEDKTVVVVGIGNSGGDLAVELSRISKQVYLVTRRGSWIFNRLFDRGEPLDMCLNSKFQMWLSETIPFPLVNWNFERLLNMRFDHAKYGLKPNHPAMGAHITVNDELPNRIASGTVRVKPGIKSFTETSIHFEDGTFVENVDEVILATGFSFHFNLIENGNLVKVDENKTDAFKYMFPMATADKNTLAVIGLVQVIGSIMPISEMQARVYLESFAAGRELPSKEEMFHNVIAKRQQMANRYVESRRHTIQVDFLPYLHELGALIGCNPDMKALWMKNPLLAWRVYFGPCVPYVFRLNGPNTWQGAEQAIWDVDYRSECATNSKAVRKE
ncbi:Flavin-containing monooxygenase [Caenorhabditis elegans]|nr:Flavin-containing monooxygenase [Caenorhabditis elegans]SMQ11474.1 Flavin-containing monooxygenase [Caenorhabditis elegans]|eukprot:NP_001338838.1 Flavin-containing monooxygenase [Caenorhabditis elegans]